MRIALVGPTHPIKGGVAQHTTVLAQRLVAAGHEVQIVSWERQYPERLYPGQQIVASPEFSPFVSTHRVLSWNRPDSWIAAARGLRDLDLVVFAHITQVQVVPYRTMISVLRSGRARIAIICHNVLPHERGPVDKFLVTRLLQSADVVLVHSDEQAAIAEDLLGHPVLVAPIAPFMPDGFVSRAPLDGEHRRLIFFGLVRPYKGLEVLFSALAAGPPDIKLRVAGEFWENAADLARLCDELGIADRVELREGYVSAEEVPALFSDVDALVLPYRSASGSQGVWTAFQFGVPAIVTRAGRLGDDIRPGVDGLLAEPGDVASLADAITQFYQPGRPEEMRAQVRTVDPDPYWDRYLKTLLADAPDGSAATVVGRKPQLAYSEIQAKMLDEQHRRMKAGKIISVLRHYLGRTDLTGLSAVDIGCSAGFISDELAEAGAHTIGIDIDRPGLAGAQQRFGDRAAFVCTSGDALPFADDSVDLVVFNHIYEHVVDPDAVLSEIHRVLKPGGVAYLGLGNKYQLIEPHYRLPFLSWLPRRVADRYVRGFGKADEYYERYFSRQGLQHMLRGFRVWDYTVPVVVRPDVFGSRDQVKGPLPMLGPAAVRAAMPIIPTYIWMATKEDSPRREQLIADDVMELDLTGGKR